MYIMNTINNPKLRLYEFLENNNPSQNFSDLEIKINIFFTGNSAGNSTGNSARNSAKNSAGNSTGNSTGNSAGNSTGNSNE